MNLANPETKVGFFSLVAILIMLFLFLWLNGAQILKRGTEYEVMFDRIEGLRPGAAVKFVGVDVGRVSRIYFDNLKVVVVMQLQPNVKIPQPAKVMIASAGVIGDKYLEISPAGPGEIVGNGKRFIGQNPVTMEQFYANAFDLLESLRTVADSIKYFVGDPEITSSLKSTVLKLDKITSDLSNITGQLDGIDMVGLFNRLNSISIMVERMAKNNEPQLNEFMVNITKVSAQLTQAGITANQFLSEIRNDGQTASDIKKALANIEKISANLEKFTAVLADKDQDVNTLISDAHETMQAIKRAAESVNKAVEQLSGGDGDLSEISKTLGQASQAAEKVSDYVNSFEQMSVKNSVAAAYQKDNNFMANYQLEFNFNNRDALFFGWDDIGRQNLFSLQWAYKSSIYTGRFGLYKSKFGLGADIPLGSRMTLGMDIWDVSSPNFDLISNWKFTQNWSMSLGGATNLDTSKNAWDCELWYQF